MSRRINFEEYFGGSVWPGGLRPGDDILKADARRELFEQTIVSKDGTGDYDFDWDAMIAVFDLMDALEWLQENQADAKSIIDHPKFGEVKMAGTWRERFRKIMEML